MKIHRVPLLFIIGVMISLLFLGSVNAETISDTVTYTDDYNYITIQIKGESTISWEWSASTTIDFRIYGYYSEIVGMNDKSSDSGSAYIEYTDSYTIVFENSNSYEGFTITYEITYSSGTEEDDSGSEEDNICCSSFLIVILIGFLGMFSIIKRIKKFKNNIIILDTLR